MTVQGGQPCVIHELRKNQSVTDTGCQQHADHVIMPWQLYVSAHVRACHLQDNARLNSATRQACDGEKFGDAKGDVRNEKTNRNQCVIHRSDTDS